MKGGLYFKHAACLEHDPRVHSPAHPDTPERLVTLERALAERDWLGWELRTAPAASEDQLALVHARKHIDSSRDLCAAGGGAIDPDTFVELDAFVVGTRPDSSNGEPEHLGEGVVTEAEATAIRAAFHQGGDLSAAAGAEPMP